MPEQQQLMFTYREVAEALVKQAGIHEGNWALVIRFGLVATNVPTSHEPLYAPAAIIPVQQIGLIRQDELNNLTVDAAIVNPPTGTIRPKARRQKKGESKA
jgi:hypothetical protein